MASTSDSEGSTSEVVVKETPAPRKRGRPPKIPQKEDEVHLYSEEDEDSEVSKAKRSPGRPKGSRNKEQKEKVVEDDGPKRARGRPRKWPPVEKPTGPKRKRGRPKKNPEPVEEEVEES